MQRRLLTCLMMILALVAAGAAHAARPAQALIRTEDDPQGQINFEKAERRLVSDTEASPLSVRFRLTNRTSEPLLQPEIQILVVAPDGSLRGYFGTTLDSLEAGETRRFTIRTDDVVVAPGETVVLAPMAAREPAVRAFDGFIVKMSEQQCDNACSAREMQCETHCTHGIKAFSCSCPSSGGITYSCTCHTRPGV